MVKEKFLLKVKETMYENHSRLETPGSWPDQPLSKGRGRGRPGRGFSVPRPSPSAVPRAASDVLAKWLSKQEVGK